MKTKTKPSLEAPETAPAAVSAAVAREYPEEGNNNAQENGISAGALAALPIIGFAALIGLGVAYKDDITEFLNWFTGYVDSMGAAGPPTFMLLYLGLEILAVPAIPLTMAAGLIFGPAQGTAMVSVSATAAATASFLIARYALRDRVKAIADENPKFAAIDRAIGEDSFRVVCLLRLSPLLPFALSNYLYGLTSVKLWPYVAGSWLGMLPGTFAYVSAGAVGRTIAEVGGGSAGADSHLAQIAAGFGFTVLTGAYITRLASNALKDVEDDMNSI